MEKSRVIEEDVCSGDGENKRHGGRKGQGKHPWQLLMTETREERSSRKGKRYQRQWIQKKGGERKWWA